MGFVRIFCKNNVQDQNNNNNQKFHFYDVITLVLYP